MIYKNFQNLKLSALGMGAMRLPILDGDDTKINETAASEIIKCAMENGINYYDTAWGYHGGNSEVVLGKLLKKYPREKFFLANKFPGYDLSNMNKINEIFEEQLKKCDTEYFDFYLFHNVCEMNIDAYLDENYGLFDYLMKQKKLGRIKHLGFSVHGSYEVMRRFLDAYREEMEFCQIQLNYFDWKFQKAKEKVQLLNEYDIPIWVMEPLRGGKLASLQEEYETKLNNLRSEESIPAWAFRFIQSVPNVTMILSGMSNMEQLKDNIHTFDEEKPLNMDEFNILLDIADNMAKATSLPCTGCRYCLSHCPKGLDIPNLIELYNEHLSTNNGFIAPMALMAVSEEKLPRACISCKSCEGVCPQQIKISEAMADFSKRLNL